MLLATSEPATRRTGAGNVFAVTNRAAGDLYSASAPLADTEVSSPSVSSTGGDAHANMQPFVALNFAIALLGVFPSRN